MEIETKRLSDGIGVLVLSGDLNTAQLGTFKEAISELLSEDFKRIIIDCGELGFVSSSGLAALLWARSRASDSGSHIYLTHISSTISDVLVVTKLSKLLRIESTTELLLEKFGRIRKRSTRKPTRPIVSMVERK